ncbi:MAG: CHAD domain-containing protein [Fuerstia sp.]|nr:CHAD domain-containing protein [Fuerstiella sp.]
MKYETAATATIENSPEESVRTVLTESLKSVHRWLKRVAGKWTEDDETVHQLRVSGRRALSALKLFEAMVPTAEVCWFRKRLKAILKAAGRARDLDVLIKTQLPRCGKARKILEKRWRAERAAAQKPLVALHRKLEQTDQFRKHVRSLVRNLKAAAPAAEHDAQSICDERILPQLALLCNSVVQSLEIEADEESLHELRIAVKRLRYAAELLLPVLPSQQLHDVAQALPELQKQLGAMQDHVVAAQELQRSIKRLRKQSHQEIIQDLVEVETRSLADSVATNREWLNSDACRELKQRIESIV